MGNLTWAEDALSKVIEKEKQVVGRSYDKLPYTAINHVFDDKTKDNVCWWTNGFYGGMLWQLYRETGDEEYKRAAERIEEKLDSNFLQYNGMDHDSGFKWLLTAVANYKFTGNEESKNRGLLAAANLAGRFNLEGEFIRAWNDWGDDRDTRGYAIIDCMMNLPLLYWASETVDDPRFRQIAIRHADTAMDWFIREDGSSRHIVEFGLNGEGFIREHGGQGYAEGTAWTRGQTWAIYGFVMSYIHTGDYRYLETAMKVADFFVEHIPESGLIPVDFLQPQDPAYEDSTAAAIAACGLMHLADEISKALEGADSAELSETIKNAHGVKYSDAAIKILKTLTEKRCDFDPDHDELLINCTAAYHDKEHHFPIIYGDYYYIEALLYLLGRGEYLW
ncbi:glycoside hydrolase family 88 protein [Butyrivibrio sp. WCD3002]|uniref:glycoside hydrolase family 88 protein n=1 Tax=Butyrivibrio sp. WCD3002 TaxID=1280676 RepID=UPI000403A38B|nr:glycoside hydrolase family 88 protein [Butyrivibrio sp. WCD3002]